MPPKICRYCLYVACHRKRFDNLTVGGKDKETFPDLKYCFEVKIQKSWKKTIKLS